VRSTPDFKGSNLLEILAFEVEMNREFADFCWPCWGGGAWSRGEAVDCLAGQDRGLVDCGGDELVCP